MDDSPAKNQLPPRFTIKPHVRSANDKWEVTSYAYSAWLTDNQLRLKRRIDSDFQFILGRRINKYKKFYRSMEPTDTERFTDL